jgi:RNA polymerase primary sigma factor
MNDDVDEDKLKDFEKSLNDGKFTETTKKILSTLTVREAMVLRERIGIELETNHYLAEVGKQFNITRQRIREIEEKALNKLRHRGPDEDGPDAA